MLPNPPADVRARRAPADAPARVPRPRHRALVMTVALIGSLLAPVGAGAAPTSREIRGELAAAQDRLDELEGIVGAIVDDYNAADEALAEVDARMTETAARIDAGRAEVTELRSAAATHVRRIHKLGPTMEIASLISTGDPLEIGERTVILRRIVDGQRADIERLDAALVLLARDEALLQSQRAEAERRTEELEARRAEVEATITEHSAEVTELEARLEAALDAEARARREAERRRLTEAALARTSTSTSPTSPTSPATTVPVTSAPRGSADVAVQAALSKLGSPYQWGSTGPDTFDCSGLMVWAWGQAGVRLPRTSREQFATLRSISRAELRPGDLVFAGYPEVHHVGLYIGDGMIVHSPYTGSTVSIRSMERADLRGFGRVG